MRRAPIIVVVLLLVAAPAAAVDQSYNAQMFRPSIFNGRFLAIEDAATMPRMCYGFGLYGDYASGLVEQRIDDEFDSAVFASVATAHLTAAFSPWRWLSMGVEAPFHVRARGKSLDDIDEFGAKGAAQENVSAFGDLKGEIKFGLVRDDPGPFGVALATFATFPTGDPDRLLGEGTINPGAKLILEKDLGIFDIAASGGYLFRPRRDVLGLEVGDSILFGAGVSRDFASGFGFSIEYFGESFWSDKNETNDEIRPVPMEALATLRWKFGSGVRIIGGGGGGFGGGLGSPQYRAVAGFDYYPTCVKKVVYVPQGRLDVIVTNDGGQPLAATLEVTGTKSFSVVTDATGAWGAVIAPGSYTISASADGYIAQTSTVELPDTQQRTVSFALAPIPPPLPKLSVRVVFEKDKSPIANSTITITGMDEPGSITHELPAGTWTGELSAGEYLVRGTAAGFTFEDVGVALEPGEQREITIVLQKKVILTGTIHFFFDSPRIRDISNPVLQDALQKIKAEQAAGGVKRVRIEGHTSSEGWIVHNERLSQRRAEAVRAWLIQRGVDPKLLYAVGYGPSKPVAPNTNEPDRQKNRRVEFVFEHEIEE